MVEHARAGKTVTRLEGGDPFVYGRGGEEAQVLVSHGVDFEVIPGITAGDSPPRPVRASLSPTGNTVPPSHLSRVTEKKGSEEELPWKHLAKGVDTLAIYMGVKNLPYIREQLLSNGKSRGYSCRPDPMGNHGGSIHADRYLGGCGGTRPSP